MWMNKLKTWRQWKCGFWDNANTKVQLPNNSCLEMANESGILYAAVRKLQTSFFDHIMNIMMTGKISNKRGRNRPWEILPDGLRCTMFSVMDWPVQPLLKAFQGWQMRDTSRYKVTCFNQSLFHCKRLRKKTRLLSWIHRWVSKHHKQIHWKQTGSPGNEKNQTKQTSKEN